MKQRYVYIFLAFAVIMFLLIGCDQKPDAMPTIVSETTSTVGSLPTLTPVTEVFDSQLVLEQAIENFLTASSLQITTHDITFYKAITADGGVRTVYGEFNTTYDLIRRPEVKVHVQSEYRYNPDSAFYDEEYYLYDDDGTTMFLTVNGDGTCTREEIGTQPVEKLMGDAIQAITQFGLDAEFYQNDNGEAVYVLEPPNWYSLSGAAQFADLGLLLAQPDGEDQVREYAEQFYPNVEPASFILHISIADQVITAIEGDNRAFMMSFWEAYDQALIEQGADPDHLTQYEIQPEHGGASLIGSYNQVPDFTIPEEIL